MLDLLTVGDIKLDTFIQLPDASLACDLKMPDCKLCIAYGKKIPVANVVSQIAGSAPNVAIGVAKMGMKTAVYSVMGEDATAAHAHAFLKEHDVVTKYIDEEPGLRSSSAAVLNYKGESTQLVDHLDTEYRLPSPFPAVKWLHVSELGSKYTRLYQDAIRAHQKGVLISFNPGSVQLKERKPILADLIAATHLLFLNMNEARTLLRIENGDGIHAIMAGLISLGPKLVVVTDGIHGAYAFDGKQLDRVSAFPGKRVEATGAGDAFTSGFLGATLLGKPHREALRHASVNAASVVGFIGPTKGLLSHNEIEKRLRERPSFKSTEL
ncbi:MAG: PfkB family carbohydrate kinase [Candidatus Uhrbacteria bacterium]|nr:PfkB family carbohydrate kinase [Candidatus Uhrbacteria bacterium]